MNPLFNFLSKFKLEHIIIAILIIVIIFLRSCDGGKCPEPITITKTTVKTDTVVTYKTIEKSTKVYIPKYTTKIISKTLPISIDTIAILNDYYSKYVYQDTIKNDSVKIYILDTISKNKIQNRKVKYIITHPTITVTNTITNNIEVKQKTQLYFGFGIGANKTNITNFGPEMLLKTKKDKIFGIGVGIDQNIQPTAGFRMYWKLGK